MSHGVKVDSMNASQVFNCMLTCAQRRGWADAAQGCIAGECEESRPVPVQVWRNKRTGETRHAWLLDRPKWQKQDYDVVHRYSCFFSCRKFHLHHCSVKDCNSLETGRVLETENGDVVCAMSGRVLHTGTTYDWKERKKGTYTTRRTRRRPGPVLITAGAQQTQHNANDWKLMQTSVNVVFDCLFSKLRHELYINTRRTKRRALESRILQYAKKCKRTGTFAYVVQLNKIAIESGFFSCRTYATVLRRQSTSNTMRMLAPTLVSLYKTLNGMTAQPTFKCFPAFAIAVLYTCQRGVRLFDVAIVEKLRNMDKLLPHPNAIEGFFRFLWVFYADSATTQRSFLTKTMNAIKAVIVAGVPNKAAAEQFRQTTKLLASALEDKYYSLVEKEVERM